MANGNSLSALAPAANPPGLVPPDLARSHQDAAPCNLAADGNHEEDRGAASTADHGLVDLGFTGPADRRQARRIPLRSEVIR